jgi:CoA:oxalate CoA-transferase
MSPQNPRQPNEQQPTPKALPGILDGIRVLDFSAFISGPYCARMLADIGAEVIKVEPPGGELLRYAPPLREASDGPAASGLFAHLNAGKRCISLDLKKAAAVEAIYALVAQCDVVVENFSPGVMKRLGLDYDTLVKYNDKLIMCSISGFGQNGPEATRPAFAPIVQAWSGFELSYINAQPGIEKPLNMGPPVADTTASLQAFGAICAALYHRERTHKGQYIDISMYDALISTVHKDFQQALQPLDNDRYYGPLKTKDGWIVIMVLSERHLTGLAKVLNQPELTSDPRFSSPVARLDNYSTLMAITEIFTATKTTEWLDKQFNAATVPSSAYRELAASVDDLQLRHRNMITEVTDNAGPVTVTNSPFSFSATSAAIRPWVAGIGEHNEIIFKDEIGLTPEELENLGV